MAQTRLEKIGTIFTRVSGLMRAGSMSRDDRPLWYDIYEAFPPQLEPRFDRPVKVVPIRPILYSEDTLRARFQREFGSPGVLRLGARMATDSVCDQVVERCAELRATAPDMSECDLFDAAVDALRADGVRLGGAGNPAQASASVRVTDLMPPGSRPRARDLLWSLSPGGAGLGQVTYRGACLPGELV